MPDFGVRLAATFDTVGHLCLGVDPHAFLLADWGLADDAAGLREFGLRSVDAAAGVIGIIKPQVAFFERHGSAGYAALEEILGAARAAGLLVIADVKRGDVGSTVAAYGQAWLTPGSPLEADAMTVSAYQGLGSLAEPIELALAGGKGMFVLAATSNPESVATQTAVLGRGDSAGLTVAAGIVGGVEQLNASDQQDATARLGSIGVVIGATVDAADYGIEPATLARTPILAPGFGEQGARLSDIRTRYAHADNVVVNTGRSVLRAGATGLRESLAATASELRGALAR